MGNNQNLAENGTVMLSWSIKKKVGDLPIKVCHLHARQLAQMIAVLFEY